MTSEPTPTPDYLNPDDELEVTGPAHLDPGVYLFTLMQIEATEHNSRDGDPRPTYTLHWRSETAKGPGGDDFLFRQITSRALSEKSNLGKVVRAIRGRVTLGDKLRVADLVGHQAQLQLGINDAGYNTVESVVAAPKAAVPVTDPETEAAFAAWRAQRATADAEA